MLTSAWVAERLAPRAGPSAHLGMTRQELPDALARGKGDGLIAIRDNTWVTARRRSVDLWGAGRLAACLAVLLAVTAAVLPAAALADNPIVTENQQPGTSAWELAQRGDRRGGQIKGYASATSVNKGGSISFFVIGEPGADLHHRRLSDGLVPGAGRATHAAHRPARRNSATDLPDGRHDRD